MITYATGLKSPKITRSLPAGQRGLVLFVALIVLVAMSLAGIALVRSVDTNVLIAGNLAFKQGATLAADQAVDEARKFLLSKASASVADLYSDITGEGYFAAAQTGFSPKTFDWSQGKTLAADAAGNTSTYVIHRMCDLAGDSSARNCVRAGASGSAASTFGSIDYGRYPLSVSGQVPAYRITVQVAGPKNTVTFVQVMVFP